MDGAIQPVLKRVDTATLHDRVYQEVRRAIMAGLYAPGQTLSLNQIAQVLGTSVMPVREALRRLAAERAVEILPKRGVKIPAITREKYAELGRVRLLLEGMATEIAAPAITVSELDALEIACEEMNEIALDPKKWQAYVVRNHEFHFAIYRGGHPQVLLPIIESLWLQSGPLLSLYGERGVVKKRGLHEAVIAALRARDPVAARIAMQRDVQNGIEFISSVAPF
jgi:DNA-binding GntR family transcriptional regulator